MPATPSPRFLTIAQVAEELATSEAQILALVRRGDLAAIKLGGRGQWRIERARLEEFIERAYVATEAELGLTRNGRAGDDGEEVGEV